MPVILSGNRTKNSVSAEDYPAFWISATTVINAEMDAESVRKRLISELLEAAGFGEATFRIEKKESGKPVLKTDLSESNTLHISFSHTKGLFIAGLCVDRRIGVDCELPERKVNERLRKRILSVQCGDTERGIQDLQLWTLKEAFLKMTGTGLRVAMNRVEISAPENSQWSYRAKINGEDTRADLLSFLYRNFRISVAVETG